MITIYVVEDDDNIRELVCYALKSSGFEAVGFSEPKSFYSELKKVVPDLILLDIMLPSEDGLSILKRIKTEGNNVPVIMLTAKDSELDRVRGLDLGADDYITKPFSIMELIARVKAVLRRASKTIPILQAGQIKIDNRRRTVTAEGHVITLTYMEYELLYYLMLNEGFVLTRNKLMDQVWGFDYEGESRTVDMHIKTLRQKLGTAGNIIKTVRNVGYKLEADEN